MEVEDIDANHQLVDENTNGIDSGRKDGVEASMNEDSDANMTTLHVWDDDDDTRDSAKVSKTDDSNLSKEDMIKDAQELENSEEDVKKYYVVEDEEELSDEQIEDMENNTNSNVLKRKTEDHFPGFDVDPYDVFEMKQIAKRIKNECVSEDDKKTISHKKTIKKEEEDETIKMEMALDNNVNCSSAKNVDEHTNSKMLEDEQVQRSDKNTVKDVDKKNGSPPVAKSSQQTQINKSSPSRYETYHKPLEMGWKRELVYRAQPSSSKDKGEAYYITPYGKKLRTKGEIMQHLIPGSGLTIENFTFTREPLGFGPDEEIVRMAKLTKTTGGIDPALLDRIDSSVGKRTPKPKAPKGASPPPQGWTPAKAVKSSSTNSPRSVAQVKNIEEEKTNKSTPKSVKQTKKGEPCTIQCVLAMGTIPQLQCVKCLCLFHHECVGIDRKIEDGVNAATKTASGPNAGSGFSNGSYICESCRSDIIQTLPSQLPQIAAIGDSTGELRAQSQPTNTQMMDKNFLKITTATTSVPTPTATTTPVTTAAAPLASQPIPDPPYDNNCNIPNPIKNNNNIEMSANLPQSIAVIKGRKYVVIRKSGRFSASSSSLRQHLDKYLHSNEITADENVPTDSPVSTPLTTGDNTLARKKVISTRHKLPSSDSSGAATNQQSIVHRSSSESFTTNFFGNVSTGYDVLLHTFQYLKVQELLRAACVCRMWNVVANHRSLWKTVRMKNSQINNWTGLSSVLRRNETKHLDLRKMLISNTNGDEMWSSFSSNIKNVTSLEAIDLCRCSSKIVENLFLSNLNLKILNAIAIKDDTLNLENLHSLQNLQELRLKSIDGCALEGNLLSIKNLINLKHLSLTSFRELGTKQISILGELTNLETLELGDCTEFSTEFVTDVLPNLTKLERLRLEKAQEPCCTLHILEVIAKLPSLTQLELVNFDVKAGFDDKLSECKNLKKLLLIPTYVSQSATTNNIVLKALLNLSDTLRTLTWVVTLELLRVTALYVVQCDDKKKDNKVFDESIPVLKPVPNGNISNSSSSSGSWMSVNEENNEQKPQETASEVPQVEILPLAKIEKILSAGMPYTKFKILKVPYHATWRQNLIEIQ